MIFYLTSKFHDNRVNIFGFMEGAFEAPPPPPPGPGTPKKPRRNRVNNFSSEIRLVLKWSYICKLFAIILAGVTKRVCGHAHRVSITFCDSFHKGLCLLVVYSSDLGSF